MEIAEARAIGAKRYFTGRPCRNGHIAERTTNNATCIECAKLSPANSRERNSQRCKNWAESNKARKSQAWREWKAANPGLVKASAARYYAKNTEKCRERGAEWRDREAEAFRETRRRWVAQNPDKCAATRALRRATLKRASVDWADKGKMAEFYKKAAELTAETGVRHEVDHIDPIVSRFVCGLHNEFNLRVVLQSENRRKSNRFIPGPPNDG